MTRDEDKQWHLDRKVPLALIVTLIFHMGGTIWLASALFTRVATLESRMEASAPQAERITRVEVKVEGIQKDTQEIKGDVKSLLRK